jgi:hypothetical protein
LALLCLSFTNRKHGKALMATTRARGGFDGSISGVLVVVILR